MKIPTTRTKLLAHLLMWLPMFLTPPGALAQTQQAKPGSPEPATAAILAAFDKYEIVGLPAAHGMKDLDDFILSLIRNPAFSEKVNDIEVECGNPLYQPVLDRYIAGEDVAFTEVRKVWRNTTQSMCGTSGFHEQLFPLVRAINQKLPAGRRLRVLAGDPPIDWDQVKNFQDILRFGVNRDANAASVMEKEVLAKRRKSLMLYGTMHLMHGQGKNAVSIYEKDYPGVTFVISDLGYFDTDSPTLSGAVLASWPIPSLVRATGTSCILLHIYCTRRERCKLQEMIEATHGRVRPKPSRAKSVHQSVSFLFGSESALTAAGFGVAFFASEFDGFTCKS
jgi:hypothetical protein